MLYTRSNYGTLEAVDISSGSPGIGINTFASGSSRDKSSCSSVLHLSLTYHLKHHNCQTPIGKFMSIEKQRLRMCSTTNHKKFGYFVGHQGFRPGHGKI